MKRTASGHVWYVDMGIICFSNNLQDLEIDKADLKRMTEALEKYVPPKPQPMEY